MADLSCLICDYTVPTAEEVDEVLALLGTTSVDAGKLLVDHLESHSLADWVRAFKMADAYIEKLEGQLAAAQQAAERALAAPAPVHAPALTDVSAAYPELREQPAVNGASFEEMFTPAERARMARQAQIRAEIEAADPNESLIPYMNPAARPEGVVGRKM